MADCDIGFYCFENGRLNEYRNILWRLSREMVITNGRVSNGIRKMS